MKLTWREWAMLVILTPPLLCAVLWAIGGAIDSRADYQTKRDSCLAAATNAYEARYCG